MFFATDDDGKYLTEVWSNLTVFDTLSDSTAYDSVCVGSGGSERYFGLKIPDTTLDGS